MVDVTRSRFYQSAIDLITINHTLITTRLAFIDVL